MVMPLQCATGRWESSPGTKRRGRLDVMRAPRSSFSSFSCSLFCLTIIAASILPSVAMARMLPGFVSPLTRPLRLRGRCFTTLFAPLPPEDPQEAEKAADQLAEFLQSKRKVVAFTGAGISTESGIPDYRGPQGSYSRGFKPMVHDQFINHSLHRARYWARSMVGYKRFSAARPNKGHSALSRLEQEGHVHLLVTFNVDGLHQAAGSRNVIDLHGRNDRVICLGCGLKTSRRIIQNKLEHLNAKWIEKYVAPHDQQQFADGDAETEGDFSELVVPSCDRCGGVLKPGKKIMRLFGPAAKDVVFFGDVVPSDRVDETYRHVDASDAVLVVGSSLMVWSGFRFILAAHKQDKPIVVLNHGPTRMEKEGIPHTKVELRAGDVLAAAAERLFGTNTSPKPLYNL